MNTSSIQYLGELRTKAIHIQSGTEIFTDAPVDNHGKGEAFSPTDLAATSLSCCMLTIMGIIAQRENVDLKGITSEVTKVMTQTLPRKIAEIHVSFDFSKVEITDDQKLKLKNAAHTCPVAMSLHPDIKQVISFY